MARADLLAIDATEGDVTEAGLRQRERRHPVHLLVAARQRRRGIYGLMEDAATAEISRSQVWQWIRHGAQLADGRTVTPELVRELEGEELEKIRGEIGDDEWFEREGRPDGVARAVRAGGAVGPTSSWSS